jgi:hypothetical protein
MQHHAIENPVDAKVFALAGKAKVTLVSKETKDRYTFKIEQAPARNGELRPDFFVKLLTGPDNWSNYSYMGMIRDGEFGLTKASKYNNHSIPVRAFRYFWRHINAGIPTIPADLEVWHSGFCGRCGRELTVPESIKNGLGPECLKKMGLD